ncbi:hydantoinase B/oxoprolinase family protein [Acuticoccus sediminis]|uniref:hydantoinase B/oxoprolinase family protein n=1 Tax=Acuticoccus sediminis TaxID=2184697 RepID=UPI001CFCDE49|nr:hydantoinase B/oxoprolinase family protein [Acuticoccus sediminis]
MDKATSAIIRSGLYAIAREMKSAMMKTAGSPIIHSGGDASAAIFDASMQLVAQGNDIPTMMGSAVISTKASVEAIGAENLRPGDVIISNDVYLGGGNHQPDVQLTRPVFVDGRIVAYTMTRGHWVDIGGTAPGSFTPVTWDLHAEGLRLPPVLLYRDDKPVKDLFRLIVTNTRDEGNRVLDINAQYAGTYVGDQRIAEMAKKFGADTLAEAMREALDYSETLMRAQIERIPDGVYEGEDFVEPVQAPGWPTDLIPIRVKITVSGDRMTFDYTGTGAQVRGGINCPFSVTCNSTWFTVKAITDPSVPINQGCYRPIEIICPEGTLLNCTYPASVVSGVTETSPRVIDMLLTTLAQAVPDRVVAQSNDSAFSVIMSGADPDMARARALGRKHIQHIDPHGGGYGGRPMRDGVSAIRVLVGNAGTTSVEQIEHLTPLKVDSWSLVPDSGGAGRWRGGLTCERVYTVGFDEATLTVMAERGLVAPKGLFGGEAGHCFTARVETTGGDTVQVPSKGAYVVVNKGDRVTVRPAGSGGYGNPLAREPERVLSDVLDGYITAEAALASYGVVLDSTGKSVDEAATRARRDEMAKAAA